MFRSLVGTLLRPLSSESFDCDLRLGVPGPLVRDTVWQKRWGRLGRRHFCVALKARISKVFGGWGRCGRVLLHQNLHGLMQK